MWGRTGSTASIRRQKAGSQATKSAGATKRKEKAMAKNNSFIFGLLLVMILALSSCQQGNVFQDVKDVPDARWNKNQVYSYNFTIEDTLQPYHVLLNVRNTTQYKYRNLFLFIETTSPRGNTVRDTFECVLANERGRWYGSGWGDIYENEIPYKKYIRFPHSGTYSIEIQQAMRTNNLKHITDIGVIIRKAKKQ
jgi:gliding motility-associated lipoprotein GldH